MTESRIAYLQLHLAVFLFGFTAILGDLISIPAASLVWWRVFFTSISLLFFIGFGKSLIKINPRDLIFLFGIGMIVAVHWVAFYASIKYSNASIALITMSLTSFFTAIIEPLILKKKLNKLQLLFGMLVFPGMILIVDTIDVSLRIGIYLGLVSSFTASIFAVLNKKMVDKVDSFSITFMEMFAAWVTLTIVMYLVPVEYFDPFVPIGLEWLYLIVLSLLCTTLAFYLSLIAMKVVSAFEANLVINLEPVYGIVLAIIILKEHKELSPNFYIGVLIIMFVVFLYPVFKKKFNA